MSPLSNIFFALGPEEFLLRDFVQKTQKASVQKYGEFAVSSFSFPQHSFSHIRAEIIAPAFLSDKKVIFVEGLPWSATVKISEEEKTEILHFIDTLANIPLDTVVFFIAPSPDKRTKAFKTITALAAKVWEHPVWDKEKEKLKYLEWIHARAKMNESSFARGGAEFLLEFSGFSLASLSTEIEKLSLLRLNGEITKEDIKALAVPSEESVDFAFANALSSATLPVILQELDTVFTDFSPAEAFNRDIIPSFRNLLKASLSFTKGVDLGVNPYALRKLQGALKKYSLTQCLLIHQTLQSIDVGCKTGKYSLSPDSRTFVVALETLLIRALS